MPEIDPPPYDDDPLRQIMEENTEVMNRNAVVLNAMLNLLVAKGIITIEEMRLYHLREVAEFDQICARHCAMIEGDNQH